jgi:hypothetical protein
MSPFLYERGLVCKVYKIKKPHIFARLFISLAIDYLLTFLARSEPALNLTTFLAAILISFPV